MKSKMVLVLASAFLVACSGFVSGATHTKKTMSADAVSPQASEGIELNASPIMNLEFVAPFESPAYILISTSGSNVKPKVTNYVNLSAILIDFGVDMKRPPDPYINRKLGSPDTKRYFKYLFERQKIC